MGSRENQVEGINNLGNHIYTTYEYNYIQWNSNKDMTNKR